MRVVGRPMDIIASFMTRYWNRKRAQLYVPKCSVAYRMRRCYIFIYVQQPFLKDSRWVG